MIKKLLATLGVIILFTSAAFSQSQIKGKVTDQSKAPLAYTRVMLKVGDRVVNMATADANGDYAMFNIEAGTYDLEADAMMVNKKMTKSNVVVPTNQVVFIDFEIDLTQDVEEVVIVWEPPVFSQDNTTSGSRLSGDNIRTTPGRSVTSALANLEGVSSVDGAMTSVRGNRSDGQQTIVDGMRVRGSTGVSMSSIEEVQLIQGGVPAEYGDGTSFTVITTKQAPKDFHGSLELRGSIDGCNNFLAAATITGPLLKGKTRNDPTRIGFLFSGEVSYTHDGSPARGGTWVANDDVLDYIIAHPLRYSNTEFGVQYQEASYLTSESFHKIRVRRNAGGWNALAQLKLDFILGQRHNMKLSLSGAYEHGWGKSWGSTYALFDGDHNPVTNSNTGRVNARFNHRVVNDTTGTAVLKNLMYDINASYYYSESESYDPIHKDRIFDYGYVGQYTTNKAKGYTYYDEYKLNDSTIYYNAYVFNGWYDSVVNFRINPDHNVNPVLSQYTLNFLESFPSETINEYFGTTIPYDLDIYQQFGALRNGDMPSMIYSMYYAPGTVLTGYSKSSMSQIGLKASVSMNIKDHELKFGYDFEKLTYRGYGLGCTSLWTLMRNEANSHITELDMDNPHVWDNGDYIYVDYDRLVSLDDQSVFDRNLRKHLGLNPDGDDWIDIDNLSPNTFSVDMFSAEELLMGNSAGSSPLVSYYGYDYTGKVNNKKTTIEDFFNNVGEDGQKTYNIGAYEPIYMAFYIQDKFAINSLLFNVGLRVDRFDANQSVLKDPYLFREAYTVGDLRKINNDLTFVGNATDDWVVYYSGNDVYMSEADIQGGEFTSQSIVGYRNGDTWYDSKGAEVTNPETALSLNVNGPILKNEIDQMNSITKVEAGAFTDYKAQWSFMPRISFSFPVNDNSLFYAHYNIITSRPTNLQISPVDYLFISKNNAASSIINNPNMKPQQSIDYEIGFRQKIGARSAISLSAYYSEKRNQIQAYRFSGAYPNTYYSYQNIDFGTVQGFTLSYKMNRTKNMTLSANYTLQFAKGTGSSTTSQLSILAAGQPNLRTLTNLSFDQRHRIGVNFDYRFESGVNYDGPKTEKVKIVDGKETVKEIEWLANTGLSILFSAASGTPYTRSSTPYSTIVAGTTSTLSGSINGSNMPWQFQCDLRIDKTFMFNFNKNKKDENGKAKAAKLGYLTVYLDIQNLFNFKNVISVYDYTGNADDDGYLSAAAYQQQINSQIYVPSYIWYYQMRVQNPYNYSRPFRASLGIQFGF
jgi:outer membrane receptor protein involved in Fe transport